MTIKSAPKDRPILIYDLGYWRPVQWTPGKTKATGYWKCLVTIRPVELTEETLWLEMPPRPK